jgi:hypothetical protein
MELRAKAMLALQALHSSRNEGLRQSFLTFRGLARQAVGVLVNAAFLVYVMPHLPGTNFAGHFGDATWSAMMVVLLSLVTIPITRSLFERVVRAAALGKPIGGKSVFLTGYVFAMPFIEVWVMSWPGNLSVHGFWGWVFSAVAVLASTWVAGKLFGLVFGKR